MDLTIYHNPRCSKSRATLALLAERGLQPRIVPYLEQPPDISQLRELLHMLGLRPRELMRRGEAVYRDQGLADSAVDDEQLLRAMVEHPILIERPIVVCNGRAALGRPPEQVLDLL